LKIIVCKKGFVIQIKGIHSVDSFYLKQNLRPRDLISNSGLMFDYFLVNKRKSLKTLLVSHLVVMESSGTVKLRKII
jgi:hypothetical protein